MQSNPPEGELRRHLPLLMFLMGVPTVSCLWVYARRTCDRSMDPSVQSTQQAVRLGHQHRRSVGIRPRLQHLLLADTRTLLRPRQLPTDVPTVSCLWECVRRTCDRSTDPSVRSTQQAVHLRQLHPRSVDILPLLLPQRVQQLLLLAGIQTLPQPEPPRHRLLDVPIGSFQSPCAHKSPYRRMDPFAQSIRQAVPLHRQPVAVGALRQLAHPRHHLLDVPIESCRSACARRKSFRRRDPSAQSTRQEGRRIPAAGQVRLQRDAEMLDLLLLLRLVSPTGFCLSG